MLRIIVNRMSLLTLLLFATQLLLIANSKIVEKSTRKLHNCGMAVGHSRDHHGCCPTQHRGVTVWAVKQDQATTSSGVMKARQRFLPPIRAAKGHLQQPQKPAQLKHLFLPTYVACKLSPAQVLFSAGWGWYLEVAINKFPRPRSQAHSHWRPFQASRKNTNRAKW